MVLSGSLLLVDIFLRGIAIGCLAAMGAALARGPSTLSARVAGGLFSLSTIAYAINSSETTRTAVPWLFVPIWMLSLAGVAYTWLFLSVLFEDRRLTPAAFIPAAVLTVVGFIGVAVWNGPARSAVWITHNVLEALLALHALRFIAQSWRGDLIEERRRLRGPLLGALAIYMLILSGFEIGEALGYDAPWHRLAGSASLALFSIVGAATFLLPRAALFGTAQPAAAPAVLDLEAADPQDRAIAARLDALMAGDEIWRREGLTIGALAEELAAPEHRVRRVINGVLGHRNFAAFVNARRVAAAKTALADPANAGRTVAAIAFDLGFGSLGPFNRAFKDETGVTPTEFRRGAVNGEPDG